MLGKDVVPHNDWKDHCDLAPASALRITALLPQLFPEGGLLAAPSLADSDTLCQPVYVSRLDWLLDSVSLRSFKGLIGRRKSERLTLHNFGWTAGFTGAYWSGGSVSRRRHRLRGNLSVFFLNLVCISQISPGSNVQVSNLRTRKAGERCAKTLDGKSCDGKLMLKVMFSSDYPPR